MILVTGTKRSGTSMWMQVLVAAGLPHIGEAFLGQWEQSIKDANPRGFYESTLRQGVFYATNPNPRTGEWLDPRKTREVVVKVFIPGLVRTDHAYVDKVVATMRHWREYGPSLARLYAMEDAYAEGKPADERTQRRRERVRQHRSRLPPAVEWWFENYDLVRDVSTRRYPIHLTTYDRLLADPRAAIDKVLRWLGRGDLEAAVAAVEPGLRTASVQSGPPPEGVQVAEAAVFDELYDRVHGEQGLPPDFLARMNEVQAGLVQRYGVLSRERAREDAPGEE